MISARSAFRVRSRCVRIFRPEPPKIVLLSLPPRSTAPFFFRWKGRPELGAALPSQRTARPLSVSFTSREAISPRVYGTSSRARFQEISETIHDCVRLVCPLFWLFSPLRRIFEVAGSPLTPTPLVGRLRDFFTFHARVIRTRSGRAFPIYLPDDRGR